MDLSVKVDLCIRYMVYVGRWSDGNGEWGGEPRAATRSKLRTVSKDLSLEACEDKREAEDTQVVGQDMS